MNKHKVIVAIDGSDFSKEILLSIQTLFKPADVELVLLQVIDPLLYTPYESPLASSTVWDPKVIEQDWGARRNAIIDEMNEIAELLAEQDFDASVRILVGSPVDEIVKAAEEEGVVAIAMATHGRSGVMRLLMGSVAESVMRRIPVPILLVRPQSEHVDFKKHLQNHHTHVLSVPALPQRA